MPTMIRNKAKGPTVFTDPVAKVSVTWQGAGDRNGGDVQAVPDSLLENVSFMNAIQDGTFEVENDVAMVNRQTQERNQARKEAAERQQQENMKLIDRDSNRVIARANIDEKGNIERIPTDEDVIDISL